MMEGTPQITRLAVRHNNPDHRGLAPRARPCCEKRCFTVKTFQRKED